MAMFFKTNSSYHEQVLSPERTANPYTYYVTCVDYGGNFANASTTLKMSVDTLAPFVVSVYKDEAATPVNLVFILNEVAECQYSTGKDFTYGDGFSTTVEGSIHRVIYEAGATYYIKCMDASNNLMKHVFHA